MLILWARVLDLLNIFKRKCTFNETRDLWLWRKNNSKISNGGIPYLRPI